MRCVFVHAYININKIHSPSEKPVREPHRAHLVRSRPIRRTIQSEPAKDPKTVHRDQPTCDIRVRRGREFTDRQFGPWVILRDQRLEARDEVDDRRVGLVVLRS